MKYSRAAFLCSASTAGRVSSMAMHRMRGLKRKYRVGGRKFERASCVRSVSVAASTSAFTTVSHPNSKEEDDEEDEGGEEAEEDDEDGDDDDGADDEEEEDDENDEADDDEADEAEEDGSWAWRLSLPPVPSVSKKVPEPTETRHSTGTPG